MPRRKSPAMEKAEKYDKMSSLGKTAVRKMLAKDWMPIVGLPIATDTSNRYNLSQDFRQEVEKHGDPTYRMHVHDWYELVIVLHGTAIHHVGSHSFRVSVGDIFVVQPNVPHYFSDDHAFAAEDIFFVLEQLPLPMEMLRRIPGFNMLMFIEPSLLYPDSFKSRLFLTAQQLLALRKLIDQLNEELRWKRIGFEASAVSLLTQILLLLARNYSPPHPEEEKGWLNRINDAVLVMEQHFAEPLSLAELARVADTSPRNFQRRFRSLMQTRPIDYLNGIRLRHAADKLAVSDMHVIDVAHFCGFNDLGYFGRKFHAAYGTSPLKYRRLHQNARLDMRPAPSEPPLP